MKMLIQYLDDIDDIFGMIGLVAERLRRFFLALVSCFFLTVVAVLGIWLALVNPLLALATLIILSVTLLYRVVTAPPQTLARSV